MKILTSEKRLIVAADFKLIQPYESGRDLVRHRVLTLADRLAETGVFIKVNSALRTCGYDLIREIQSRGLGVFADLKLFDISETLSADGELLAEARPELLTVSCVSGIAAMQALKAKLPATEILGVTVLTSLTDADSQAMFCSPVENAVLRLAQFAENAGIDGLICSPKEAEMLRAKLGVLMTINTPGIRPSWFTDVGDQNPKRVMTPALAIKAGADRIVVGRPITKAENPRDAVMRTIEEIASAA